MFPRGLHLWLAQRIDISVKLLCVPFRFPIDTRLTVFVPAVHCLISNMIVVNCECVGYTLGLIAIG